MSSINFTTRDLPSRGLFYDKVYNIKLNSLTLGQYKEFMRSNDAYYKQNIITVLNNIVETDGIDIGKMLYGDVISILMWYKCNSSIDTNLSFNIKCNDCENRIDFNVNLGQFDMVDIEGYDLGVTLPSGKYLKFSPKTFLEYEKSNNVIEHICNVFKYLTPYDVDSMDLDDFMFLKDYVENFKMGFEYNNEITCHFCKRNYKIKLDAEVNYLLRRYDYNAIMRNIFYISKFSNYKFTNDEDLFDFETSINVVSEMMEKEREEIDNMGNNK